MSVYGGPDIITDGLVLHLDAANRKSYPLSGSTIYDLSGNGVNASMTNNTAISSDNNGVVDFTPSFTQTSSGNRITTTPGEVFYQYTTELTACCWFKRNGTIAGGAGGGQSTSNVDNWNTHPAGNVWLFHGNPSNTITFYINMYNSGTYYNRNANSSVLDDNTWYFLCGTVDTTSVKMYINGSLYANTATINGGNIVNNSNSTVQYGKDPRYSTNRFFNGWVGANMLYNRTLSADEIRQNYNALKGRYGL